MTCHTLRKAYIRCIALGGVAINLMYGAGLLGAFFDPQYQQADPGVMISAIALEFGWAALLLWVVGKPCERRHIVLFTALPMVIAHLLHRFQPSGDNTFEFSSNTLELAGCLLLAGLFVLAFFVGRPREGVVERKGPQP